MMDAKIKTPGQFIAGPGANSKAGSFQQQHSMYSAPSTIRFWLENSRWRTLPYCQGRWKGPHGLTRYLVDRDYRCIAFVKDGELMRGAYENLRGCYLDQDTASYFYGPEVRIPSPASSKKTLVDLLYRSAQRPETSWIFAKGAAQ